MKSDGKREKLFDTTQNSHYNKSENYVFCEKSHNDEGCNNGTKTYKHHE